VHATKRLVDIVVGSILSIVLAPIILAAAIGSTISFRAWPFFVQDRVGRHGDLFRFIKIRSLPTSTHDAADKYELSAVQNTRFGRLLRRFHADELPQLWLVVTGRMSLVGPRPEMPPLAARFDPDFVAERVTMRPGCTGLWQVSTASACLIGEAPEFDLYYVRNWTFRMDLWLLVWTLLETLGGPAIKDVGQIPTWTGAAPREVIEALT
jgi:lipopolysaccharide/colanic/teichoic acid biosynthesis glycosyltransferase